MTGAAACVLEARELRVSRGGVEVLDVPSFRLHEGELVAIIGPNGSGKSSLLLALMCLLDRSAGEVLYRGHAVGPGRTSLAARRKLSMILQEPLLFDGTVHDNVSAGLEFRGRNRREIECAVAAALDLFGIGHLAARSARKLSGGEARRVSLARALAVCPDVLFLDEPFASLDPPTRQSIVDDLARTIREERIAAVLVTHDQAEALRLSDRLDVMSCGRIVQSDAPAVVMNHPSNEFVARCVGMETILEGVVRRRDGGECVVAVAASAVAAVGEAQPGERVYCCIRPEAVTIDLAGPPRTTSARNVFPARVLSCASVGPYVRVELDCGFPLVAHVTQESFVTLELTRAGILSASFKATAVHLIRR
jgi:tungstate transport system ATP-binding protein